MSNTLTELGNQEIGSKVKVKTVCDAVMADFWSFSILHMPLSMVSLTTFNPGRWTEISKRWSLAAIKLLANLGYVKLRGAGNFDDKEFVSYHACAQLRFENGQYKQKRLVEILQERSIPASMH